MAPDEADGSHDRREGAAPVFDDDPDPGVVDHHGEEDERGAECRVGGQSQHETRPFGADIERRFSEETVEDPDVQPVEQRDIDEEREDAETKEAPEVSAGGGEEAGGARRPVACQAIDHRSAQERPDHHPRDRRADDGRGERPVVQEATQVVQYGAEADDRWSKGRTEAGGLKQELLPPLIVAAGSDALRHEACAQLRGDHAAQCDGQRQGHEQRHEAQAGNHHRRAVDASKSVPEGCGGAHIR